MSSAGIKRWGAIIRLRVSGNSRQSGSKLHAVQTLARAPKLPDFAERLDCVKLASAFESERLSAICELGTARGPFQHHVILVLRGAGQDGTLGMNR